MSDKSKVIDIVNINYKRLEKKINKKGQIAYRKIDLHIHTPASNCYVKTDKKNTEEQEYNLLIKRIIDSEVEIFAITDHNNINGYEKIMNLIKNNPSYERELRNKLILPGIEIDCYGNHFLAIFSNELSIDKIKNFIINCGLENEDIPQSADRVTPLLLCEEAHELNGIIILAHADSTKGFLNAYFKSAYKENIDNLDTITIGKTIETVLNHNSMLGVSINDSNNINQCKTLLKQWKNENKKILRFSDSHSSCSEYDGPGKPLGERCCYIKIGNLSYYALINSLKQINNNVFFEKPVESNKTYAIGLAVKGGFLINNLTDKESFALFPFSSDLNCLIGARGTGKSTLLEIIDYIYNFENIYDGYEKSRNYEELYNENNNRINNRLILNRFNQVILYIRKNSQTYALYMQPESLKKVNISIFIYNDKKSIFTKLIGTAYVHSKNIEKVIKIREELKIKVHKQKDLQNMTATNLGIFNLIDDLNGISFGMDYLKLKNEMRVKADEIKDYCKNMIKSRKEDHNSDYSNDILEKNYKNYLELYKKYISYFEENIKDINNRLKQKLVIDYHINLMTSNLHELLSCFENNFYRIHGSDYSKLFKYKNDFNSFINAVIQDYPDLIFLIFTHNVEKIYLSLQKSKYKMNKKTIESLVEIFWRCLDENAVVILPLPIMDFKLNVNYGFKNKDVFVERSKLSFGQKTVAALLLIMHGAVKVGDNIPLIIDQPEDDLDNSYIYHMLIKQFNDVKENKQLILATHNPNIPVCGEAENIIILESNGKNGWLEHFGTIDNDYIVKAVLKILEGDFAAFKKRAEIYGFELHQKIFF